jgi:hypothetical protein
MRGRIGGGLGDGLAAVRGWPSMTSLAVMAFVLAIALAGCASVSRRATPGGAGAPDSGTPTAGAPAGGAAVTGAPSRGAAGTGAAAGAAGPGSVEQYAAAIKANSARSDHESDANVRAGLAAQSSSAADACLALDPKAAACQYGKAVATGMEARAHPLRAAGLLNGMLQNLGNADASDPNYDEAGPSRVRALVLIRAPGWPVGPGDNDAGLAAARRAVLLQPDYPPNVLALAEALSKTGDEKGARENYARARDLAQALPPGPDRDDWLRDAGDGL